MPMVRAMRMLNAIEAGTLSGAQLETLLTSDPGRLAEWNQLLAMRGDSRRLAASSTAMSAVAASSTAMSAVAASSTAMQAVVASSTAMAAINANDQAVRIWMLAGTGLNYANYANVEAVAASSTAMAAVLANSQAMAAVVASSTAMAAVVASSTAMAAVVASSTAMQAVIASSTALNAVVASSTAMQAVAASSTAMQEVAASSTAMAAVVASSTAKTAMYNSDTALNAVAASSTAIAAMRAAPGYAIYNTGTAQNVTSFVTLAGVANGLYIALGVSTTDGSNGATISLNTPRSGTTRPVTRVTDSSSVSSSSALGAICCPITNPVQARSTDGSSQVLYVGLLRCDV